VKQKQEWLEFQPVKVVREGETTAGGERARQLEKFPRQIFTDWRPETKTSIRVDDYVEVNIDSRFESAPKSGHFPPNFERLRTLSRQK
jgi:hypothetical protein